MERSFSATQSVRNGPWNHENEALRASKGVPNLSKGGIMEEKMCYNLIRDPKRIMTSLIPKNGETIKTFLNKKLLIQKKPHKCFELKSGSDVMPNNILHEKGEGRRPNGKSDKRNDNTDMLSNEMITK